MEKKDVPVDFCTQKYPSEAPGRELQDNVTVTEQNSGLVVWTVDSQQECPGFTSLYVLSVWVLVGVVFLWVRDPVSSHGQQAWSSDELKTELNERLC